MTTYIKKQTIPLSLNKTLRKEFKEYEELFYKELHDDILYYWIKYSVERKGHGFYGAVDLKGKPVLGVNKSVILNARILWTFAAAAKMFNNDKYAAVAEKAYSVVTNDFEDKEFGGYFMELSSADIVANDIKHTYAQTFVLYSLCKYYEYNPSPSVMDKIKNLFSLLESKAKDVENVGYIESFTRDWKIYDNNRMTDNDEPKSMNTHLHVLEAYAGLFKVWKDEIVRVRLTELIKLFLEKIIRPSSHFGIFYDIWFNEAEATKGISSFGHDIEGSWLLWEAAEILGDSKILSMIKPIVLKIVDVIEREAVDKDGGLFLESYRFGSHIRTNKHWWLQAETLVGFMNAFGLTGEIKYWETVKKSWNFINTFLIDHEFGEWFTKLNRMGKPFLIESENDPSPYYRNDWKIDPWKCPYHNGRAMMEMIQRLNRLQGRSI